MPTPNRRKNDERIFVVCVFILGLCSVICVSGLVLCAVLDLPIPPALALSTGTSLGALGGLMAEMRRSR